MCFPFLDYLYSGLFFQAKALMEWHNSSRFCGHCGSSTFPIDAGRRRECSNDSCKKRSYPRVDPVFIILFKSNFLKKMKD